MKWKAVNSSTKSDPEILLRMMDDKGREDFANNVEYYLFEPNVLKEKTPKAFNWIIKTLR